MLESDDIHLSRCYTHHDRRKPNITLNAIPNVGRDKSFVDDLNMERGIVSTRVGFVLRSAEIQPFVPAICHERATLIHAIGRLRNPPHPHPNYARARAQRDAPTRAPLRAPGSRGLATPPHTKRARGGSLRDSRSGSYAAGFLPRLERRFSLSAEGCGFSLRPGFARGGFSMGPPASQARGFSSSPCRAAPPLREVAARTAKGHATPQGQEPVHPKYGAQTKRGSGRIAETGTLRG